jgi:hypothetical protein
MLTQPATVQPDGVQAGSALITMVLHHHKEGSRKGKVHQLFDEQGAESAWVLGLKLKFKEGTLRSWFAAWKRLQSNSKARSDQFRYTSCHRTKWPSRTG